MALLVPLRSLSISLVGIFLAHLYFNKMFAMLIVISLSAILLGVILERVGLSLLHENPTIGLFLMEFWIITPSIIASIAAGAVVILAVTFSVTEEATSQTKELVGAITIAITAFLTAGFIEWTGNQDASLMADRIKANFQSSFLRHDPNPNRKPKPRVKYFQADSVGERLVYAKEFKGIEGWSGAARKKRAKLIAQEIKSKRSDP